jgi:hypothetical protein
MFTTFLRELEGYFDRHWILSVFFPSLVFWSAGLLVYGAYSGFASTFRLWQAQSYEVQIILTLSGLAWVIFFALVLGNFQTSLIRFYEGYWQFYPLKIVRELRVGFYQARSRFLQKRIRELTEESELLKAGEAVGTEGGERQLPRANRELREYEREWLLFFPYEEDKVMPTRLGNVIRAAELHAWSRYGIDAVIVWPRLHPFLPQAFISNLVNAKTAMTLMLMASALAFAFALIACTILALFGSSWILFLLCALGLPLAWLCYLNSLHSAAVYAEQIKAAFDLYRRDLLKSLHLKLPTTYEEEVEIWTDVTHLLYRGEPPVIAKYENNRPEPEPKGWVRSVLRSLRAIKSLFARASAQAGGETASGDANQPRHLAAEVEGREGHAVVSQARQLPQAHGTPAQLPTPVNEVGEQRTDALRVEGQHLMPYREAEAGVPGQTSMPFDYFKIISFLALIFTLGATALFIKQRGSSPVEISVLSRDVPPYHLITHQDLERVSRDLNSLPPDAVREDKNLINHLTTQSIQKGRLVNSDQVQAVRDIGLLADTVVVGIPATSQMTLGNALRAGDVIDITLVPEAANVEPPAAPSVFENLLVLDVRPAADPKRVEKTSETPFIVIIALPIARRQEFAARSAHSKVLLSRKP